MALKLPMSEPSSAQSSVRYPRRTIERQCARSSPPLSPERDINHGSPPRPAQSLPTPLRFFGIDLFAGAGGMSTGAVSAGVDVVAAIEIEPNAASTYASNHPLTQIINDDVRKLRSAQISALSPSEGQLILFGGPPCQGFSYSNPRHRNKFNPTNWLFLAFLRYIDVLAPEWVVFENVPGLRDTAHGYFLRSVKAALSQREYLVIDGVMNAVEHGVPQNRSRYFVIANRIKCQLNMPRPHPTSHTTVRDAIQDLPAMSNGNARSTLAYGAVKPSAYAKTLRKNANLCYNNLVTKNSATILERYKHIPPGGNWQDIPERLMANYSNRARCHTGIYHRLQWDKPSIVIGNYRKNMLIHPDGHRGLSVREAARLQSFPDSYRFHGSIGFQQQQVANAVPPLLAARVFDAIIQSATMASAESMEY